MIAFSCAGCGMKFNVKDEFAGRSTRCPTCKQPMVVPAAPLEQTLTQLASGPIDGTGGTLAQAGIKGGVSLDTETGNTAGQPSVRDLLDRGANNGGRYVLEGEIARGGMGAVLRAVDCDIRREVAVKYMLDPSDPRKKLRFVEEAQITGQLEHPNIVPIHELGVDAQQRVFFSMKMVKGRSLAQVLDAFCENQRTAEKEYSLVRLLNIFMNVCNALAYAHARGVIHRDLKPANIMVGDFGEVYVMDWGLAKVLKSAGDEAPDTTAPLAIPMASSMTALNSATAVKGPAAAPLAIPVAASATAFSSGAGKVVTSREPDADLTQEGAVMGTPVYMSPEQARGQISAIDQRSDVYSLGAILYELLALRPPISKEGGAMAILLRVAQGEMVPPEQENRQRARSGRIPRELSAIAMKALAKDPEKRYPTVEALRQDIERFLEGRSVSAKEDSRREVFIKFVKRNKAFCGVVAGAAGLLFVVGVWSLWVNYQARLKAEKAYAAYEEEQKEKEKRTQEAVPALVESARRDTERRQFDKALKQVKLALEYDSDNLDARLLKAQLLIVKQEFKEARSDLDLYTEHKPKDVEARDLRKLCGSSRPNDKATLLQFTQVFARQKMPTLTEGLLSQHRTTADEIRKELLKVYRQRINDAWPGKGDALTLDAKDRFQFSPNGVEVNDLSPLQDIPLGVLALHCPQLKDLTPLEGMPLVEVTLMNAFALTSLSGLKDTQLTTLNMQNIPNLVSLDGLKGAPLTSLVLNGCGALRNLKPLEGMPLTSLTISNCGEVRDLSPLKGMPLTSLTVMYASGLRDLTPLADLPLTSLNLTNCAIVHDLTPLHGLRLTSLDLTGCTEVRDLTPLRGMPLTSLVLANCNLLVDLSGLAGLKLTSLNLVGCGRIKDLSPLADMPLTSIDLHGCGAIRDVTALKGKPLTVLNLDGCISLEDLSGLKGMPLTVLQLSGCAEVQELTPLQGMPLNNLLLNGCVKVNDLTPLKDSPLTQIDLRGCSALKDVSALKGMKFTRLDLTGCAGLTDLSGLKGMPLSDLTLNGCSSLEDLSGLKGLPLGRLNFDFCDKIHDLSPLEGMPLNSLALTNCGGLADLTGLKGAPLGTLNLANCKNVRDLSRLKGLPLKGLTLSGCSNLVDLSGLKGLALTNLDLAGCGIQDLTPLQDMPLQQLILLKCVDLHDLTPLAGLKLVEIHLPPQVTKGMETVRAIKTLQSIDGRNPQDYWKQYDASQQPPK